MGDCYYHLNGLSIGPLTPQHLHTAARLGTIRGETLVWSDGSPNWMPYDQWRTSPQARQLAPSPAGAEPVKPPPVPSASQPPRVPLRSTVQRAPVIPKATVSIARPPMRVAAPPPRSSVPIPPSRSSVPVALPRSSLPIAPPRSSVPIPPPPRAPAVTVRPPIPPASPGVQPLPTPPPKVIRLGAPPPGAGSSGERPLPAAAPTEPGPAPTVLRVVKQTAAVPLSTRPLPTPPPPPGRLATRTISAAPAKAAISMSDLSAAPLSSIAPAAEPAPGAAWDESNLLNLQIVGTAAPESAPFPQGIGPARGAPAPHLEGIELRVREPVAPPPVTPEPVGPVPPAALSPVVATGSDGPPAVEAPKKKRAGILVLAVLLALMLTVWALVFYLGN